MTDEHGIAGGADDHAQHGEPYVRHAHRGLLPVANAQHVTHGLEQSIGILLPPGVILERQTERQTDTDRVTGREAEKAGEALLGGQLKSKI